MNVKDRIIQQLTESKAADPMLNDFKARFKKIESLKWDPAKAVYEKPGKMEKEGASTSFMGTIKGQQVAFWFSHPEVTAGRMVSGWIFMGVATGGAFGPNQFMTSGKKIEDTINVGPPIKRMSAWSGLSPDLRRANLKELDDAIRKFS